MSVVKVAVFAWVVDGDPWEALRLADSPCPVCGHVGALTSLPPPIQLAQHDNTTLVCNPAFGGCNQGFES